MDTNNQLAAFFPLSKTYQPGDALLLTALPDAANDALCSDPYFISATGECLVMTSGMRKAKGLNGNRVTAGGWAWSRIICSAFRPVIATDGFRQASASRRRWNIHEFAQYESHGLVSNNNPVSTQTPVYDTALGAPPPLTNGVPTTTQQIFLNAPSVSLSNITAQLSLRAPSANTPDL